MATMFFLCLFKMQHFIKINMKFNNSFAFSKQINVQTNGQPEAARVAFSPLKKMFIKTNISKLYILPWQQRLHK